MKIGFSIIKRTPLKNKIALKNFLKQLADKEKKEFNELNFIFCSDEELLDINKRFLNHDYYTDIITFNLSTTKKEPITGEVYISIDRIKDNALTFKTTTERELHRIIFHGLLHLCGYNDKTPPQKSAMTKRENHYLKRYFND
jgi:rRNA maturation RNase YbeY